MYEQVAASRLRMASQLSASKRYVSFLEAALETRRAEVAAALSSMQILARVRSDTLPLAAAGVALVPSMQACAHWRRALNPRH